VIDVVAVPDWLEQAIGKAQQQDVLDGDCGHTQLRRVRLA
jgi:hypothetical protein